MTRQQNANKFIKYCFIYSGVKYTNTLHTGSNQQHKPVNHSQRLAGRVAFFLPNLLPDLLQSQDWMVKLDLKDAYLQVPNQHFVYELDSFKM